MGERQVTAAIPLHLSIHPKESECVKLPGWTPALNRAATQAIKLLARHDELYHFLGSRQHLGQSPPIA